MNNMATVHRILDADTDTLTLFSKTLMSYAPICIKDNMPTIRDRLNGVANEDENVPPFHAGSLCKNANLVVSSYKHRVPELQYLGFYLRNESKVTHPSAAVFQTLLVTTAHHCMAHNPGYKRLMLREFLQRLDTAGIMIQMYATNNEVQITTEGRASRRVLPGTHFQTAFGNLSALLCLVFSSSSKAEITGRKLLDKHLNSHYYVGCSFMQWVSRKGNWLNEHGDQLFDDVGKAVERVTLYNVGTAFRELAKSQLEAI